MRLLPLYILVLVIFIAMQLFYRGPAGGKSRYGTP